MYTCDVKIPCYTARVRRARFFLSEVFMSQAVAGGILEKVFKLSAKNTTVRTEIIAGITTFVAMAYILFVNPSILTNAGIPREAAVAATIWSAGLCSLAMGLFANFPVALAPGMGLNAFFAFYVCGTLGLHWVRCSYQASCSLF